jgi:hypothetical protein
MNNHRTTSILQRLPVILAVTAASYGLQLQARAATSAHAPATGVAVSGQRPCAAWPAVPAGSGL